MNRDSRDASPNPCSRQTALRDRRGAVCLLGVVLLLLLAGCGRVQQANPATPDSYAVTLAADPAPPVVGDGAVSVTLRDAAGRPVDNAQLAIEANMSHAGMTPVMADGAVGQGRRLPCPAHLDDGRRLVRGRQVHPAGRAEDHPALPGASAGTIDVDLNGR